MDLLESKNQAGETITGYHIRMKGITKEGLENAGKEYIAKDDIEGYLGLYTFLAGTDSNGKANKKEIVLNPYNVDKKSQKVLFEFKSGSVKFRDEFSRVVKF